MNEKVSVIIPIYKVEQYLSQCVESVINQTYKNLEIVLVDDGSPDNCPQICDEYAKKDARIQVVHKENGGSSSARNAGIEVAQGEYIMFLDGDDWLDKNTINHCVQKIEKDEKIGCVLFSYVREYPQASLDMHLFEEDCEIDEGKEEKSVYRRLFGLVGNELKTPEQADSIVSCCMKLYRAGYAKQGVFFDTEEVGSSEDALYNMYALYGCEKFAYINKSFYHYRKAGNSLTSTYRPQLIKQWNRLFDIMQNIIIEKNLPDTYNKALQNRIALSIIGIGMNEFSNNRERSFFKKKKQVAQYLRSDRFSVAIKALNLANMPFKWKVFMFCSKHKFSFCVAVLLKVMLFLKSRR